ncbi:unnamed protein product [Leuciscus chuanchicus]
MGLVLRNLQTVVPLRRARMRKDVEILRHIFGVQRFDMGIICVDNRRIQRINRVYRRQDRPTDVLAFPFHEDLRPVKMLCVLHRDEYNDDLRPVKMLCVLHRDEYNDDLRPGKMPCVLHRDEYNDVCVCVCVCVGSEAGEDAVCPAQRRDLRPGKMLCVLHRDEYNDVCVCVCVGSEAGEDAVCPAQRRDLRPGKMPCVLHRDEYNDDLRPGKMPCVLHRDEYNDDLRPGKMLCVLHRDEYNDVCVCVCVCVCVGSEAGEDAVCPAQRRDLRPGKMLCVLHRDEYNDDLRPGKMLCVLHRDEYNLGDIFLGVECVMQQCRDSSQDLHETLTVVTAHGICHLLGYRHETEEDWNEMQQKESYILSEFNRLTGRRLQPLTKRCSHTHTL